MKKNLKTNLIWLAIIAVVYAILSALIVAGIINAFVAQIITQIGINLIVAVGLNLVIGRNVFINQGCALLVWLGWLHGDWRLYIGHRHSTYGTDLGHDLLVNADWRDYSRYCCSHRWLPNPTFEG